MSRLGWVQIRSSVRAVRGEIMATALPTPEYIISAELVEGFIGGYVINSARSTPSPPFAPRGTYDGSGVDSNHDEVCMDSLDQPHGSRGSPWNVSQNFARYVRPWSHL